MIGIKEYIGDKVALISTHNYTYGYGDKGWQNLEADEEEFIEADEVTPKGIVYLHTPIKNRLIINPGGAKDRSYDLIMMFLFKSYELLDAPEHNETLIQLARNGVMNFINLLDADSRIIKELSNIVETETENEFDVNATGIILTFTIQPKNFDSFCL